MKLLIGGSPCTHWSIAQTKDRETEPDGLGWELFKNYLVAKEKYKPDLFLYENNKSMSKAIADQITRELGVTPIMINSALVSAQSRKRLYWTNITGVEQPEDRGILVRDILESGLPIREKAYTLKTNCGRGITALQFLDDGHFPANGAAEPIRVGELPGRDGVPGKSQSRRVYAKDGKAVALQARKNDGRAYQAHEVRNGYITINGEAYPARLPDGLYIIRKLTVLECMRLQTVPEWYVFPVSPTQAYKMLGNGWTVDVIAHILSYCLGLLNEPVEVLSMYDGMSCGRLALEKLGAEITRYYATEIDKYAIKTTQTNFPDIVQLGDAFQVREESWWLPEEREEHT